MTQMWASWSTRVRRVEWFLPLKRFLDYVSFTKSCKEKGHIQNKTEVICLSKWDRVIFSGFLFLWNSVCTWAGMPLKWTACNMRIALVINWNCSCLTVVCCDWCLPTVLHNVSLAACNLQFKFCLEDYRIFWEGPQWGYLVQMIMTHWDPDMGTGKEKHLPNICFPSI